MRNSLKNKVLLTVIILIVFFGSIATVAVFSYSRNNILNIQRDSLKNVSTEQSHEILALFEHIISLSSTLAKQDKLVEYVLDQDRILNDENIVGALESYNIDDSFLAIYFTDATGNTLASTDPSFVGQNYFFRDYFKKAVKGESSVEVAIGITSKQLGYYFSSPILDYSGNTIGVVVFKADPNIVNNALERFTAKEGAKVMFVDRFGVVVFSELESRLFSTLGQLSKDELAYIEKEKTYENITFKVLDYSEVKESFSNIFESKIIEFYNNEDKKNEIVSVSKIGPFPFYLLVEEDANRYMVEILKSSLIVSAFVILAALAALVLIFLVLSRILAPLGKITTATKEISSGNYDYKLDIKTGDEMEDLSNSFNQMSSEIKAIVASTEKKVEDRTKRLSKINKVMLGREKRIIELKKEIRNNNK